MIKLAVYLYLKLVLYLPYLAPVALLLLRLGWGWESFDSGRGHLSHAHFQDLVDMLQGFNVPMPNASAVIAGTTELVGGVLIMLGLATRLIAIPFTFNFAVAIATDDKKNVLALIHTDAAHLTENYTKIVDYTAYPFLIMGLILIAFGPGLFSVDGILKKWGERFPKFWGNVLDFAVRWEATVLGTVVGVLAAYPVSYYFQPDSVKKPITLSDYVCQIYDLFNNHAVRDRALIFAGSFLLIMVGFGLLIDIFVLKRKPARTAVPARA